MIQKTFEYRVWGRIEVSLSLIDIDQNITNNCSSLKRIFLASDMHIVLKDPDSNPYSLLDNTESDQTADTDASESHHSTNRRRRSRRRRTDEDAVLMDGMTESDTASVNENGLGM